MRLFGSRTHTLMARARRAASQRDWARAAELYTAMLKREPARADWRVQQGHAFNEMGRPADAEQAYGRAADDAPHHADAPFHLGKLLLSGGREEEAAVMLARALDRDPLHEGAFEAMWHAKLLLRMPASWLARIRQAQSVSLGAQDAAANALRARIAAADRRILADYASVRPSMTKPPPTLPGQPALLHVVIDARSSDATFLRMTLDSLAQASFADWRTTAYVGLSVTTEPIASLAALDPRIAFVVADDTARCGPGDVTVVGESHGEARHPAQAVYLTAGTRLDREALAWLAYAFASTSAQAITCDWDWCRRDGSGELSFADPELHGVFDMDRLLAAPLPPPLIALREGDVTRPLSAEGRRLALAELGLQPRIGHVPLPLAAIGGISARAGIAPECGEPMPLWSQARGHERGIPSGADVPALRGGLRVTPRSGRPPLTAGAYVDPGEAIRVIIPTRDCAAELEVAVDSLLATASRPQQLVITIIDNRSTEAATQDLLVRLAQRSRCQVLAHDLPFNWAAINNRGAEQGNEPILVLANNDIRMLSPGWDDRLRAQLQRQDVGIVGSRLLYPDGTIQHAGMIFGIHDGAPAHDGVGLDLPHPESDVRFDHCHACSAVTGAFLALRRAVFREAGGIDAVSFIVAYNDIDLCMAVRRSGKVVLYDPGIELIHLESHTRGRNVRRRKVAWDQEEWGALREKWGAALAQEPGLSPWWARDAVYAAFRPRSADDIAEFLRHSAERPWQPRC